MIPIIFEKDETTFENNGLGRLRDCISCIVTEERNGIYECDFEYPIDGANYDLIQVGRIIGVTHDESDDIQPFDIVSFTKPIDGIVSFHCVHISYRLSYMTILSALALNTLPDVFNHITTYAKPNYPFSFWTDKTNTGYCAALNMTPITVRQALGGIEGSVLDTFGGEYEWDRWQVKLWSARGQYRDFAIRYGVNMLDYNEEYDTTNCYSSCRPYWTDGTTTVLGDKQDSGALPPSGRDQCVPLDVSEKFEDQPTKAQVEAMGLQVMNNANPTIPSQNITVSFVRLQDMGEFADFQNLLQCKLCDTINVIFPDFNSSGTFKIVRTTWNVLTGKYDEMELGDLSISLSEALGITNIQETSKSTIEQIQNVLDDIGTIKSHEPSAVSCGSSYYRQLAYVTLPQGTWIISGVGTFPYSNTTGVRRVYVSDATSAYDNVTTAPAAVANMLYEQEPVTGSYQSYVHVGAYPIDVTTETTYRLIGWQNSGGSISVTGRIYAIRIK